MVRKHGSMSTWLHDLRIPITLATHFRRQNSDLSTNWRLRRRRRSRDNSIRVSCSNVLACRQISIAFHERLRKWPRCCILPSPPQQQQQQQTRLLQWRAYNTELYNNNNNDDDDILDAGNRRQTIDILGLFFLGSKVARPTGLVDQTRPRGRCVYVSGARLRYAWPNQAAQILCRRRLTLIRPSSADGCCAGIGCSRYHQRSRRRQRWWTIESVSGRELAPAWFARTIRACAWNDASVPEEATISVLETHGACADPTSGSVPPSRRRPRSITAKFFDLCPYTTLLIRRTFYCFIHRWYTYIRASLVLG